MPLSTEVGALASRVGQEAKALWAALAGKVGDADPRLSDARTPTAHAASHATGGSDAITPASISALAASLGARYYRHGANAGKARPLLNGVAWPGVVVWRGTVQPDNWISGDEFQQIDLGEE